MKKIIFIIDNSLSMVGSKVDGINYFFANNFKSLIEELDIPYGEISYSIIAAGKEIKWIAEECDINTFDSWNDLNPNGKMNLNKVLEELENKKDSIKVLLSNGFFEIKESHQTKNDVRLGIILSSDYTETENNMLAFTKDRRNIFTVYYTYTLKNLLWIILKNLNCDLENFYDLISSKVLEYGSIKSINN